MSSVRYYNQTAPFWDFVARMEDHSNPEGATSNEQEPSSPWDGAWAPFGPFAFRGRHEHGPRGRHHHGAPPQGDHDMTSGDEKDRDPEAGPSEPHGPPPPFSEKPDHHHGHGHDHGHHKGGPGGSRGRCGGRGGRGPWGGRARGGPGGPMSGLNNLAELFQSQLFGDGPSSSKTPDDFRPDVDVFDTPAAFVVHVALPGAKKEDVGVNWDAEKSELAIAGVIHRPGDEEFLKTLALDERKVGVFERKVRLGSRANPAQIDVEGISARMEDGVLRVEVPKMDGGFVEIRKVDIL